MWYSHFKPKFTKFYLFSAGLIVIKFSLRQTGYIGCLDECGFVKQFIAKVKVIFVLCLSRCYQYFLLVQQGSFVI